MSILNETDAAKALVTPDGAMLFELEHEDGTPAGRTTLAVLATFLKSIMPTLTPAPTATAYTLTGTNSSDPVGTATTYGMLPTGGAWPSGVVLTPAATGLSGSFNPTMLSPSGTAGAAFSFTPSAAGSGTISVTSSPAMTNPAGVALTATAAQGGPTPSLTLTAPTGVQAGANFTISGTYANDGTPTITYLVDGITGNSFMPLSGSTISGGVLTLQIHAFQNAGTHTVQVQDGSGNLSNVVSFTVAAAPATAAQPTGVTLSNATETSLKLTWTAPNSGPTPTAYDLALSTDGGVTFVSHGRQGGSPMVYSAIIGSLVPSTSYIAQVTGVTGDIATGPLGAPSANSNTLSTTATTSPPTTPTSFSGTPSFAYPTTAISLSWTGAVPPYVASATLTQRTPSGSGNFVPSTYTFNGGSYLTARGLTPGSSYDFQLVLTNSIGSTPAVTLTNVSTASA